MDNKKVYFGVDETIKVYLPKTDKEQWFEIKKLKASKKAQYFNKLGECSKPVKREDGKYDFVPDPSKTGELNKILLELSIVGYNVYMMEAEKPVLKTGYDVNVWNRIYETMDEDVESILLDEIKKLNPSLTGKKK